MSEPTNQDYLDVADMLDDEPIKGGTFIAT